MKIDCSNCPAACCRYIECEFITDDYKCSVYDNRPDICRVDVTYERLYADKMTKDEYMETAKHYCRDLLKRVERGESQKYDVWNHKWD